MDKKLERLKRIIEESNYTVAMCGSGMLEESGNTSLKTQNRAYEIEEAYGASPEYIFGSAYYNTRPEKFFRFYQEEMLKKIPDPTPSSEALARMEEKGKMHCIITSNLFEQCQRAGCRNVINLHGSIFRNKCPHCGKEFDKEYILNSKNVPRCDVCGAVVRPQLRLYGEMLDSQVVARTVEEVEKADVLLLLGTTLESEVYASYIRYFKGKNLVIIHKEPHHSDEKADLVFISQPKDILPQLGY